LDLAPNPTDLSSFKLPHPNIPIFSEHSVSVPDLTKKSLELSKQKSVEEPPTDSLEKPLVRVKSKSESLSRDKVRLLSHFS